MSSLTAGVNKRRKVWNQWRPNLRRYHTGTRHRCAKISLRAKSVSSVKTATSPMESYNSKSISPCSKLAWLRPASSAPIPRRPDPMEAMKTWAGTWWLHYMIILPSYPTTQTPLPLPKKNNKMPNTNNSLTGLWSSSQVASQNLVQAAVMNIKDNKIILSYPGQKYLMPRMNKRRAILMPGQNFLTTLARAAACPPSLRSKKTSRRKRKSARDGRAAGRQRALANKMRQKKSSWQMPPPPTHQLIH